VNIGKRVRNRRDELGLTRKDIEAMVTFTDKTLENIEKGSSPTFANLLQLAKALKTSVAYLIGETDNPSLGALKGEESSPEEIEKLGYRERASDDSEELTPPEAMDENMRVLWYEFIAARRLRRYVEGLSPRPTGTKDSNPGEGSS
jgi:transcriptional regulator with XRE-family HTH domain